VSPRPQLLHRENRNPAHPFVASLGLVRCASNASNDVSRLDRVHRDDPARIRPRASTSQRRPNRFRDAGHTAGGACDRCLPSTPSKRIPNRSIAGSNRTNCDPRRRPSCDDRRALGVPIARRANGCMARFTAPHALSGRDDRWLPIAGHALLQPQAGVFFPSCAPEADPSDAPSPLERCAPSCR